MKTTILILTDNKELQLSLKQQLLVLDYPFHISKTILELKEDLQKVETYYLIIDDQLKEADHATLLLDVLYPEKLPSGLIVMSDLLGFENFMDQISERYTHLNIPFLFLEAPFEVKEFKELLFRLCSRKKINSYGSLRRPKYNYIFQQQPGSILKAARANLGLDKSIVVKNVSLLGLNINEERLEEIEKDKEGNKISCYEWFALAQLLHVSSESVSIGFEPWFHLRRVHNALEENVYSLPLTFILKRRLADLARRDRLEQRLFEQESLRGVPRRSN